MARERQGACKTPGGMWTTRVSSSQLRVQIDMPGVVFGVSERRAEKIEQAMHDALEQIAADVIAGRL